MHKIEQRLFTHYTLLSILTIKIQSSKKSNINIIKFLSFFLIKIFKLNLLNHWELIAFYRYDDLCVFKHLTSPPTMFQRYSRVRHPPVFFVRKRYDSARNSPIGFSGWVCFHTSRLGIHVGGQSNYRLQSNQEFARLEDTRGKFHRNLAGIDQQRPPN